MQIDYWIFMTILLVIFILQGAWMYVRIHKEKIGLGFGFRKDSVMGNAPIYVLLSLILTFIIGWFPVNGAEEHRRTDFARSAGGLTPTLPVPKF